MNTLPILLFTYAQRDGTSESKNGKEGAEQQY
jgi:hypothetical protein